jgi:predicted MFS family arabinose efflux permease
MRNPPPGEAVVVWGARSGAIQSEQSMQENDAAADSRERRAPTSADQRVGLARNPALICALHALFMSFFAMAVITLFYRDEIGMSVAEILGLQAIFGALVALLEFPTGYLADRIGYRRSLVLASLFAVSGWGVYCAAWSFWSCFAAEALLALGFSLASGVDTALLYESLLETGRESEFTRWFARYRSAGQIAEGSAALVAGLLYAQWIRLPFALTVLASAIAVVVAMRLTEPERPSPGQGGHWQQVRELVRYAAIESPRLRAVMFLSVAFLWTSFMPVWLIQLYATDAGVPVAWLGPIWACANYTVAVGSLTSDRLTRAIGFYPVLALAIALAALGYAGLGLAEGLFGTAFYFAITLMRGLNSPPLHHEEQRLIPSRDRAGLLSLRSLGFRGGFAVLGPLVGLGADRFGIRAALLAAGALLVASCSAGWLWLRKTPSTATRKSMNGEEQ